MNRHKMDGQTDIVTETNRQTEINTQRKETATQRRD